MLTFCTLFDSNYLDKGLVLYESMTKVMGNFKLYILAMDDKCEEILKSMNLSNIIVISLKEFEDNELLEIKTKRARAEYCWTCTASLIDYVLKNYNETYCTYVDSDLYFYENPQILIEEMDKSGCSVQIVEHGFGNGIIAKKKEKNAGKYCVQFNTFKSTPDSLAILKTWKEQTRNHCSMEVGEMGDQKYLTDWAEKYEKVHVLQHPGGGVAPWNIVRYKLVAEDARNVYLMDKKTGKKFELIFYHFHHLEYFDEQYVNINVFKTSVGIDENLVHKIYIPYLRHLEKVKKTLLKEYGFQPMIKKHPGVIAKSRSEKIKELRNLDITEFIYKISDKVSYSLGKEKDIIDLEKYL